MQIIDITTELSARTPVFQSDPHVHIKGHATIAADGYAVSSLAMGSHSGTHMDAPCHMIEGGKTAVDAPLNMLIGPCLVVDTDDFRIPPRTKRLLIRDLAAGEETLNVRQAEALLEAGVRLVGTDSFSIGDDTVHRLLLEAECLILECLDLKHADPGRYILCALPLKVACDGAPVRACLMPAGER